VLSSSVPFAFQTYHEDWLTPEKEMGITVSICSKKQNYSATMTFTTITPGIGTVMERADRTASGWEMVLFWDKSKFKVCCSVGQEFIQQCVGEFYIGLPRNQSRQQYRPARSRVFHYFSNLFTWTCNDWSSWMHAENSFTLPTSGTAFNTCEFSLHMISLSVW